MVPIIGQPFDGLDFLSPGNSINLQDAGFHGGIVYMDGTGPTLGDTTAIFSACKAQMFTEHPK